MGSQNKMSITFLGGASQIGASCALLEVAETPIIIDCGTRFVAAHPLPNLDFLSQRPPQAILVTHGHTDHTGGLPVIHHAFPDVPVYMTPPTIDLVRILLYDTLKLMNLPDREGEIPLYAEKHVESLLKSIVPVHLNEPFSIGPVRVRAIPAAHILGATMYYLETPAGNILFTGDFSISGQITVPDFHCPPIHIDCVVSEATYGNRLHSDRKLAEKQLLKTITDTILGGGKVLIPAFAIGRAQELILLLRYAQRNKRLPLFPIYVDGMIRAVCNVYTSHDRYVSQRLLREIHRQKHPFYNATIQAVTGREQREAIIAGEPCVIIASSGMLWGGPSQYYAKALLGEEKNALLLTGYQDEESPGRAIRNMMADTDNPNLVLDGETITVQAHVDAYNLSAHADRLQITALIESLNPRTVIFVHGENDARQSLRDSVSARDVLCIDEGDTISRSYPIRKRFSKLQQTAKKELTRKNAEALIGPATGNPISDQQLAFAWFGKETEKHQVNDLIDKFIAFGLVKRDTQEPSLVWPLAPPARNTKPTIEDIALEEKMKKENPKGTLLSFCARRKIEPPQRLATIHKGCPVVELKLTVNEKIYSSDPVFAFSEKVAEQCAAQKIIEQLNSDLLPEQYCLLTEKEELALKTDNPKGKLLEYCLKSKNVQAIIDTEAVVPGFLSEARLEFNDERVFKANTYLGTSAKNVEQAAAKELLWFLETSQVEENKAAKNQIPAQSENSATTKAMTTNPKVTLNHLQQIGTITNFGYTVLEQKGPPHQPVFVMQGWYELPEGNRTVTNCIETGNKKEGQNRCALLILEQLRLFDSDMDSTNV